jgi:hypothetical protein
MSDCPWSAWKLDFNATLVAGLHPGTKADARVPVCDETPRHSAFPSKPTGATATFPTPKSRFC